MNKKNFVVKTLFLLLIFGLVLTSAMLFSLCMVMPANAKSQPAWTNEFVHATPPTASLEDLEGAKKQEVLSQFGKVPAFFIENKGQTAKEVKYYFKGNDNVYFTDNGVMFQKIVKSQESNNPPQSPFDKGGIKGGLTQDSKPTTLNSLAYKLEFIGARPTSSQARGEVKGKVNHLIGNDRSKWHTNIPTYQEIVYPGLYPSHSSLVQSSSIEPNVSVQATSLNQQEGGIDLVYKGVSGGMKYEFVVQPGANPDDIRLAYTGIEGLSIEDAGNLIIHTALGDVKDTKPYCYQEIDGKEVEVGCNFVIRNGECGVRNAGIKSAIAAFGIIPQSAIRNPKWEHGFEVASYNKAYPLVIDPGLEYSTFLGGSGNDEGRGIAVDAFGNAYVTGTTYSINFPATLGTIDNSLGGSRDAFVTKLDSTGSSLVFSTFLGGSNSDDGNGIVVDASGNTYVRSRQEITLSF